MRKAVFMMMTFLLCISLAAAGKRGFSSAVREAVNRQMQAYPKSTLADLYKNFFQDKFGPGHIIADTTSAGNYLRREMASYALAEEAASQAARIVYGPLIKGAAAEPTGWEGQFFRVNLSVVKSGRIPYDVFFDAFVRSVNGIRPIAVADWHKEWNKIEKIIRSMNLHLPEYDADKQAIEDRLNRGEYVGEHSEAFIKAYDPHYRIVSRTIFEKELKSYLQASHQVSH